MTKNKKKKLSAKDKGKGCFIQMRSLIPGQLYRVKQTLSKSVLRIVLADVIEGVRPHPTILGQWTTSSAKEDCCVEEHPILYYGDAFRGNLAMFIGHRWPGNEGWGVFLLGDRYIVLEGYHLESDQPVKWAV